MLQVGTIWIEEEEEYEKEEVEEEESQIYPALRC
jgi:hypothetical protein